VSEHPTGTAPRRTATTPTGHPIAPTESPRNRSAAEPGHPREGGRLGLRHTALGWRVPAADTPANGGSCGRPPPGNLTGNAGQRPTVHRPHPRRGHEGPRASTAIRAPGRPPRRGAGRGAPAGRSGSRVRRVTSPMLAIASGAEEPASGRERCKAIAWGPTSVSRADFPSPTYIHRPCWDPCPACKGLVAKKGLHFDDFCMANVKLGCIPYKNRPDRSPVEWAGRGL
jgi:hypothetical protein